jgi:GNAT superfamily N-acetyltransferase
VWGAGASSSAPNGAAYPCAGACSTLSRRRDQWDGVLRLRPRLRSRGSGIRRGPGSGSARRWARPQSAVLIAEDGGALIAFCTEYLEFNSVRFGRRCWVEDFAVDPERRSQGVGTALLNAAGGWARGAGARHLELDSSLARADAHRFYEREGGTRQSYSFGWEL